MSGADSSPSGISTGAARAPRKSRRGDPRRRAATGFAYALAACAGTGANTGAGAATVVDFTAVRWTAAAGGDGRLRTLVVVSAAWSWHDADALAASLGAELSRADTRAELAFLELQSDHPGAFDCAGPWLGGFREPGGPWLWRSTGASVPTFGWAPLRPAQGTVFPSALLMSGIDGPDGRWIDVFPEPDAGVGTRAAFLTWTTFADCDADDRPDLLEIARDPALDANGDGLLDACEPPNPADVNRDGLVDAIDLAAVLNTWGSADASADIDGDGVVGATDLAAVLSAWSGG